MVPELTVPSAIHDNIRCAHNVHNDSQKLLLMETLIANSWISRKVKQEITVNVNT